MSGQNMCDECLGWVEIYNTYTDINDCLYDTALKLLDNNQLLADLNSNGCIANITCIVSTQKSAFTFC